MGWIRPVTERQHQNNDRLLVLWGNGDRMIRKPR
ncbi:hypothetical protein SPLC1_S204190 [Arthrospira platensis C1]|nr:hypothetical protein SPLC1_S204190 [Arthrospira platensis C1]